VRDLTLKQAQDDLYVAQCILHSFSLTHLHFRVKLRPAFGGAITVVVEGRDDTQPLLALSESGEGVQRACVCDATDVCYVSGNGEIALPGASGGKNGEEGENEEGDDDGNAQLNPSVCMIIAQN